MGIKPHFMIVGFSHAGICAIAESMVNHNHEMMIIEKAPAHGPSETTLETLTAELDKLSAASKKAKNASFELSRVAVHTEMFMPKKVHPKHQKNNKYRFKK